MTDPAFDITPSPRVLRMLGQIDFKAWQCLAELIDNSLDAILSNPTLSHPATVHIGLPTVEQLGRGAGQIVVQDSGPGMTPEELQLSVKAGYSGNDPVEKLGLFGMGFNIATARLGRRTEVWTIRSDADDWTGVTIDFDELERGNSFVVARQRRPRSALEPDVHGTVVTISKLDAERVRQLVQGRGKGFARQRLGRIYSRIIQKRGVSIIYGADAIEPRRHCTWDARRAVDVHPFGLVPAIIDIDEDLGEGSYCSTCWIWLDVHDEACPSCGTNENVIVRERRIRGWIGLQRFFDLEHYGFDLLRNGRVVEELDKSLFYWSDEDNDRLEKEYPIDAMYLGGRFVGELEIDFVRVSHQKDAFDKHDPQWARVVEAVRGKGPIRPKVAEQLNFPRNTSPLARLFAAYRQTSPAGLRNLIPADSSGNGIFQEAKRWAEEFWKGTPEYQSDDKWYEAARLAEEVRRAPVSPEAQAAAAGQMPVPEGMPVLTSDPDNGLESQPRELQADEALSLTFELPSMPGSPLLNVKSSRLVAGTLDGGLPALLDVKGNNAVFQYDPDHRDFRETLDSPTQFLIREVAYQLLLRSGERQSAWPLSRVERQLRARYFQEAELGVATLGARATTFLDHLRGHLIETLPEVAPMQPTDLTSREIDDLRRALASMGLGGEAKVEETLRDGSVAKYLGREFLIRAAEAWPTLVLDGRFLAIDYSDVLPDKRHLVVTQATSLLADVLWLAEQATTAPASSMGVWKEQLARAAAGLNLLEQWRT